MTWLIYDGIVVVLIVASILIFMHKGFLASIVGLLSVVLSLVVAWFVSDMLAPWAYTTFVRDRLYAKMPTVSAGNGALSSLLGNSLSGLTSGVTDAAHKAIDSAAMPAVRMVLFAILFVVLFLVLRILEKAFRKANKAPVLGFFNKILGGTIGLVVGVVLTVLVSLVLSIIVSASFNQLSWLNTTIVDKTIFFKHFYYLDLLKLL